MLSYRRATELPMTASRCGLHGRMSWTQSGGDMAHLLAEIRRSPLLWLLVLVPVVLTAHALRPEDHTLLFVLSVAAIVPLAALLSRATESVAARIGDMAGGLLNATLGNLTELLIALAALRAGQYVLGEGLDRRRNRRQRVVSCWARHF